MKPRNLSIIVIFAVLISVWACTHLQPPVSAESTGKVIEMTASDFKFEPNNITARTGASLTFKIKNVSGTTHNFTLKDPDGKTMKSVDLPPRQTVELSAAFAKPGTYKFTCNKTGHTELGMKGQVVVE